LADKLNINNWDVDILLNNKDSDGKNKLDVLLAEDEPSNQLLVERYLHMAGHNVTIANNGQEALKFLDKHTYDVCIFDMQMPVMNGLEAVKFYKSKYTESKVPIIILTANTEDKAVEECVKAGADMHLAKPVTYKSLVKAVETLCLGSSESVTVKKDLIIDIAHLDYFKDPVFLNEFIEKFEISVDKLVKELENSLDNNYDGFMDTVHSIKGLSGNINAHSLRDMTIEIECMTESEYIKESHNNFKNIVKELSIVRQELVNFSSGN